MHVWHPPHISWLTIILGLITIGTFIAIARPDIQYYPYMRGGVVPPPMMESGSTNTGDTYGPSGMMRATDVSVSNAPMMSQGMGGGVSAQYAYPPDYYPYPSPDVPANDTRELLKVNYGVDMRTRDVPGLTRHVETTVRGHGGRIDQESSSPESGYVSFVVPMSKYDAFRSELEDLVDSRFLTVNIQSSNMLPQKQSIEDQQKQADSTLADYQASRAKLVTAHAGTVKSLQAQIDADTQALAVLRQQPQTYDVQTQVQTMSDDLASLQSQLANENADYKQQLSYADESIKSAQDWQKAVKTQDQALMDNVATVNGSVSIEWISLWEMARVYLPGYWIPAIFAILTILSYLWDRRRLGSV